VNPDRLVGLTTINLSNVDAAGLSDRDIIVHVLENGGTHDHIVVKLWLSRTMGRFMLQKARIPMTQICRLSRALYTENASLTPFGYQETIGRMLVLHNARPPGTRLDGGADLPEHERSRLREAHRKRRDERHKGDTGMFFYK
jgi:hypothetical protein